MAPREAGHRLALFAPLRETGIFRGTRRGALFRPPNHITALEAPIAKRIDREQAAAYDRWHETEHGTFALAQEKRLLQHFMAPWTRRQQRLLEVGCGSGRFLQFFWESGFDVSGLDASPAMLELARNRMGCKADLHLGRAEHLPFEDKEFDIVALLTLLEFCDDPGQTLNEALRVARKAILVTFLNKQSIYIMAKRMLPNPKAGPGLERVHWFSWWGMRRLLLHHAGRRPMFAASVLPGPRRTWSARSFLRRLNCHIWPPFLGAYSGVRCDLVGERPLTPIMALKQKAALRPIERPASSGANRTR